MSDRKLINVMAICSTLLVLMGAGTASKMSLKDTLNKRDFRNYKKLSSNGMNRLKCKKK